MNEHEIMHTVADSLNHLINYALKAEEIEKSINSGGELEVSFVTLCKGSQVKLFITLTVTKMNEQ